MHITPLNKNSIFLHLLKTNKYINIITGLLRRSKETTKEDQIFKNNEREMSEYLFFNPHEISSGET